ncbi:uncharacterized protein LOC143912379 [Arctopsyche grandis]|uniref:uncharacterized protein LOC143912379 n=1 Tax=Arctopsyche grandis TaxID=121162 RepID=UPI00406D7185
MTMLYQNVRGLNSKTVDCLSSVLVQHHDFIALTETWLNESVCDFEIFDDRYLVFRRDRASRGGGVLLAVRADRVRSAQQIHRLQSVGDFNTVTLKNVSMELSHMCNLFNLSDLNNVCNVYGGKLDLVLSNIICNSSRSPCFIVPEDKFHPTLSIDFDATCSHLMLNDSGHNSNRNCNSVNHDFYGWKFNNVDFAGLNSVLLESEWIDLFECLDVNAAVEIFNRIVHSSFNKCFNKKFPKSRRIFPSWFSAELIVVISRKCYLHKRWKFTKDSHDYVEFCQLRSHSKKLISICHADFIKKCSKDIAKGFAEHFKSAFVDSFTQSSNNKFQISHSFILSVFEFNISDMEYGFQKLKPNRSFGPDFIPDFVLKGCKSNGGAVTVRLLQSFSHKERANWTYYYYILLGQYTNKFE